MSGLARKPNAHRTPSFGDTNHCTIRPRSNRTMQRSSPLVSDIESENQSPTTSISGSAASRSRKRCSQLSENITLVGSRRYAVSQPAGSVFTFRFDVLVDPGDDHVGELKVVA